MRLGLDTFSLRFQGFDAFQFLDYAAEQGLDLVQFSTWENLASHEPSYLAEVRAHASRHGLQIEVGMGSIDRYSTAFRPELGTGAGQLNEMCHAAAALGSPLVRCFLGMQADRLGPVPIQEHIAECVRTLQAVAPLARELGLKVAVENHGLGDLLASELKSLVEQAGPDYVGVTLDTGNPTYAGEDPLYTAEILRPYIVTTHFRDTSIWEDDAGAQAQWTILGQGTVDLRALLRFLETHCPSAAVNLETITGGNPRPVPYLDQGSDYWRMYPAMPAQSLARYIALARQGSREGAAPLEQLTAPMGQIQPPEVVARLRQQQREHCDRSVAYAREQLGLGERAQPRP
jgi:sugar phosphate isomerase/epimerase